MAIRHVLMPDCGWEMIPFDSIVDVGYGDLLSLPLGPAVTGSMLGSEQAGCTKASCAHRGIKMT